MLCVVYYVVNKLHGILFCRLFSMNMQMPAVVHQLHIQPAQVRSSHLDMIHPAIQTMLTANGA